MEQPNMKIRFKATKAISTISIQCVARRKQMRPNVARWLSQRLICGCSERERRRAFNCWKNSRWRRGKRRRTQKRKQCERSQVTLWFRVSFDCFARTEKEGERHGAGREGLKTSWTPWWAAPWAINIKSNCKCKCFAPFASWIANKNMLIQVF